jgi:phage/plasmid-associated DNA primase
VVEVAGQAPTRENPSRKPSPPGPSNSGGGRELLKYTHFAVLKLTPFMVHKLKAAGLTEILEGFEPKGYLEELDVNYRYFIFKTGECVEAEGKRFTVQCSPIREGLDLERLLRGAPPVEGSKLKMWIEKLREFDRELSEADREWAKLMGLDVDELKNDISRILVEASTLTKRITMVASRLENAVLEHFKHVKNLHVDGVDLGLYCWDGKRYTLCEANVESWIEDAYHKLGLEEHGIRFTVLKREILEMLSDATRHPLKHEEAVVAFENCAFNWDTLTCEPHNPEKLITHYIPHQVDVGLLSELLVADSISEDAVSKAAPKTLKAFKEWAGGKWILLLEILGFTLYPRPYKKAVLLTDAKDLVGRGDTGKSTYIRYLQGILGPENYSVVAAQEFTKKNQDKGKVSMIYRKLANFYPDLPEEAFENIGEFKVVTGEDAIPIRMLYKQAFVWRNPYVKHIYSANKPPMVRNADDAFWNRWLVVEFIGGFREKIKNFERTLYDEIPRAIAIGIAAFHKVLKRGSFSFENTPEDAKIEWLSRSDSIFSFILWAKSSGALVEDPTGKIPVENLYPYYSRYCMVKGLNPVRQEDFTRWLKNHGFEVKAPQRKSIIYGYRLKTEILEQLLREEEGEGESPEPESYGLGRYYES